MILLIIMCLSFMVFFVNELDTTPFIYLENDEGQQEKPSIITYISAFICLLSIILYCIIIICDVNYIYDSKQQISALNDSSNINGSRYYIREDDVIKYITGDNVKTIKEVNANKSVFIEDGKHELIIYKTEPKNKVIRRLYYFFGGDDLYTKHKYEFHLPKESLTNEFNIDLQK